MTRFRPPNRLALSVAIAAAALAGAPAATAAETLTFTPEADTYVGADAPAVTHGSSSGMDADASPAKQSFVRFRVAGIAGRTVTSARLRMRQADASRTGGRVWAVSSTTWPEALTWGSRPALDGPLLATFGAVQDATTYEVELGPGAVRDGVVSYGIDSPSSDGARWATRESATPPVLSITVEDGSSAITDGISTVAGPSVGSSEPTYYSGNRRLAVTSGGRTLAVFGRHANGVQLSWRDPAGAWRTSSTGASADGGLLTGTGTGDWPASIALGRDAEGNECAWVVWSGENASSGRPFQMRRLTQLDAPEGPRLGPLVTIDPATGFGAFRGDVALERTADGRLRGVVVWSRQTGTSTFELVTRWFTDLGSDEPAFHSTRVIERSSSSARFGSLVPTTGGTLLVARVSAGLGTFSHDAAAPLDSWSARSAGPSISARSAPVGVALANGSVLIAVERDATTHVSEVYRYVPGATSVTSTLKVNGLAQPTITGNGTQAWLVGVRSADGNIVSRAWDAGSGWTATDRLEVGPEAGGGYGWPSAARDADGRLRLIFEGAGTSSNRSAVLAFQRP